MDLSMQVKALQGCTCFNESASGHERLVMAEGVEWFLLAG